MKTQEKIQKLEKEVATLWQILDDDRLWHPSIVEELLRRSRNARLSRERGQLKTADKVFSRLSRT